MCQAVFILLHKVHRLGETPSDSARVLRLEEWDKGTIPSNDSYETVAQI